MYMYTTKYIYIYLKWKKKSERNTRIKMRLENMKSFNWFSAKVYTLLEQNFFKVEFDKIGRVFFFIFPSSGLIK